MLSTLRKRARAASAAAAEENIRIGSPLLLGSPVEGQTVREPTARYLDLLELVLKEWSEIVFCEGLVLDLHGKLSSTTGPGTYRTERVQRPLSRRRSFELLALDPSNPERIAGEMLGLIQWASQELESRASHPLWVIANFLPEFLAIQPFVSGNHRVARVLTNLLLMQNGYSYMPYASLEKAIADRRAYYDIGLRTAIVSRKMPRPDISTWLEEFLQVLRAQASELRRATERRPQVDLLSENQTRVHGLFGLYPEVTVRLAVSELSLSRDTAKQVLSRLHSLGLVERLGCGRAARYREVR